MVSDCAVLVVGDAGRSQRMQYHVASLAQHYPKIDFIGNFETSCIKEIEDNENIKKINLLQSATLNCFYLIYILTVVIKCKILLVQNTPAIPSLLIPMLLYPILRYKGTTVIIDWHNLSYTISSQKYGRYHIYTVILQFVEWMSTKVFPLHICVSETFRSWLQDNYNIRPLTFYDKPYNCQQVDDDQKKKLLQNVLPYANENDRPRIIMTSTSWTADERFDILWNALGLLDKSFTDGNIHFYIIISGKGEMRKHYETLLDSKPFDHIQVLMFWIDHTLYSQLLSCVDFGICLHDSTSGLDLPMKIVDMLGCGIPVLAKAYSGISELINPGLNGKLFNTEFELYSLMKNTTLQDWNELKKNIENAYQPTFKQSWNENMYHPISCCM